MTEYITEWVSHSIEDPFVREEIVRCRDCRYYMDYEYEYEPNLGYCRLHDMEEVKDSRFCAWGERRES